MKIKLLSLLLASVMLLSSLFSCGGGETPPDDGTTPGSGETPDGGNDNTDKNSPVAITKIVYSESSGNLIDVRGATNKVQTIFGKRPSATLDTTEAASGELILGNSNRAATATAKRALERHISMEGEQRFSVVNYTVAVKDGSIALVWDSDRYITYAMNYLYTLLAERHDELVEGFTESVAYDFLPEMLEHEAKVHDGYLDDVEKKFNKGVRDAVDEYLAMFDSDIYMWLANLYDPRVCICDNYDEEGYRVCLLPKDEDGNYLCHGGGFYYSNSARNTPGFGIDVESTAQILYFLESTDMLEEYDGSFRKALPKQMQNDIVAFVRSLQDPETGYFYHPQWGTDIGVSRLGRDIEWSIDVLSLLGYKPLYNTPTGVKGELGAPGKASLTAPLEESIASAASKVTLAADIPQLESLEAFKEYLATQDLKHKSYQVGHRLSTQFSLIRQRDRDGLASGEFTDANGDGIADDGLYLTAINFFLDGINPENGLWEDEVHYDSVNALMKIGTTLHGCGYKLPYAAKSLESAITMLLWDPDTPDVKGTYANNFTDVFNAWVSINKVKQNISYYGDGEEKTYFNKYLKEHAEEMIRATMVKAAKFEKYDGSYGYTWTTSPSTSQGVPASVPGSIEGDVNGGLMINGSWKNMTQALGIKARIYYGSDFARFIYTIENLEPVVKVIPNDDDRTVLDFEGEKLGEKMPERLSCSTVDGGMSVVSDPKNEKNNVVRFYHKPSDVSATRMYITPVGSKNPTCHVLAFDMYVESAVDSSTSFQIHVSDYLFTMGFVNGKVKLGDASSTNSKVSIYNGFGEAFSFGEWHNVRIEFYTDIGDGTCRSKIYVDDILFGISDNFEGKEIAGAKHTTDFQLATIYALIKTDESVLFDNIECFKDTLEYTEGEIGEKN